MINILKKTVIPSIPKVLVLQRNCPVFRFKDSQHAVFFTALLIREEGSKLIQLCIYPNSQKKKKETMRIFSP